MSGYFALILHAHLPFVRHPEHETFLEENWLFEAITETYLPLLKLFGSWANDGVKASVTLTLSPTLCSMLQDPLLQTRYLRYLEGLIDLAEKETYRTLWQHDFLPLAKMYLERFQNTRTQYLALDRDLVRAYAQLQDQGRIEIITCAATHGFLPLMAQHPSSIRAQILTARDHYHRCFGRDPRGIWLPECAYVEEVEASLQEANIRWFVTESHGVLNADPQPRYGLFAPVFTPKGIAAFGRDLQSAKQVWSKDSGYPGDPHYRDFYRDIGYDLDLDYLRPHLPASPFRSFTGLKYYSITGSKGSKKPYSPEQARVVANLHAEDFLQQRISQFEKLGEIMDRPPLIVCPYDAELFGHWWYEGPVFLDFFCRKALSDQNGFQFTTPDAFLKEFTTHQLAKPSPSSWGEDGYWKVWLNEKNEWIYRHLQVAQERMTELANRFFAADALTHRALQQAGRELLLAQASDWPFIIRSGTSPDYATKRVRDHLEQFQTLYEQLTTTGIQESWLSQIEAKDNIFPELDYRYWA